MNLNEQFESNELLAKRLRNAGRQAQPHFSPELHARILAAVRESRGQPSIEARRSPGTSGRAMRWSIAAVASVAIALGLGMLLHRSAPVQNAVVEKVADNIDITREVKNTVQPEPSNPMPPTIADQPIASANKQYPADAANATNDLDSATDDLAAAATDIGTFVQSTADGLQWYGLDRDAQAALDTVTAPLPFDLTFSVATAEPDKR